MTRANSSKLIPAGIAVLIATVIAIPIVAVALLPSTTNLWVSIHNTTAQPITIRFEDPTIGTIENYLVNPSASITCAPLETADTKQLTAQILITARDQTGLNPRSITGQPMASNAAATLIVTDTAIKAQRKGPTP